MQNSCDLPLQSNAEFGNQSTYYKGMCVDFSKELQGLLDGAPVDVFGHVFWPNNTVLILTN